MSGSARGVRRNAHSYRNDSPDEPPFAVGRIEALYLFGLRLVVLKDVDFDTERSPDPLVALGIEVGLAGELADQRRAALVEPRSEQSSGRPRSLSQSGSSAMTDVSALAGCHHTRTKLRPRGRSRISCDRLLRP